MLDIVPWKNGEATEAASTCFAAWLRGRGGIEPSEITEGIGQVLANLHAHGSSRFEAWTEAPHGEGFTADRTPNRLGWRRKNTKGQWEYYVTPDGFREMTKSFDRSQIAAALVEKGYLAPDGTGRTSKSISVPGYDKQRLYHFVHTTEKELDEHGASISSTREDEWS